MGHFKKLLELALKNTAIIISGIAIAYMWDPDDLTKNQINRVCPSIIKSSFFYYNDKKLLIFFF